MSFVITPPAVSTPRLSGLTSRRTMFSICDDLTPLKMAAWRRGEEEKRGNTRRGGGKAPCV
jgi:hypothetical protein